MNNLSFNFADIFDNLKSKIMQIDKNNIYIVFLIIYISVLSIYTPRHIISLINHPLSKLIIW